MQQRNHYREDVWKCDLNYHKVWRTFALNYRWFEKLYQTFESISPDFLTPRSWFRKKLRCASFFQPTSWCLENR